MMLFSLWKVSPPHPLFCFLHYLYFAWAGSYKCMQCLNYSVHIKYVRHQSSIRLDSYTLDLRLPVSHAKVHKTGKHGIFWAKIWRDLQGWWKWVVSNKTTLKDMKTEEKTFFIKLYAPCLSIVGLFISWLGRSWQQSNSFLGSWFLISLRGTLAFQCSTAVLFALWRRYASGGIFTTRMVN